MANEYIRKEFNGGSPATTVSGALSDVATSITVASGTGLPTGATGRFVMVIDRGLATEEKVLVTTRSGTTLQNVQRGYDGTAAQNHLAGAAIEHCLDAYTLDQVNALANAMTAQYDLVMRGASAEAFTRIPVGADNTVLSVQGGVPQWVAPGTASIADGSVSLAKLAAAVQNLLVPAGAVMPYIGSSAPTGWLSHNQSVGSAQSLYPSLWAAAPASWKSGSTLNIPNLADTVLAQTGGSAAALGATGGSMTTSIGVGNLPPHDHTINHDHGAKLTTAAGGHVHPFSSPAGTNANGIMLTASASSSFALGNGGTLQAYATYQTPAMDSAGDHQHTVDLDNFTGSSGSTGGGTDLTTRPKHLGVNFIIKAH